MNNLIELLQNQHLVWQGSTKAPTQANRSTGYKALDQHLEGGFQKGVTEIQSTSGLGELRLLLPALQEAKAEQRLIAFIAPSGVVSPQALLAQGIELDKVLVIYPDKQQDCLWAAEQCLRSGACNSVIMWTHNALEIHQVKRLQVACEVGNCLQFILRETKDESISLPFDLSLSLQPHTQGLSARINKRKRGWPSTSDFLVNMSNQWPALTLQPTPNNLLQFPSVKTG